MSKISTLYQLCTCITFFWYKSLPSLHEYDVKLLCWPYHINVLDG